MNVGAGATGVKVAVAAGPVVNVGVGGRGVNVRVGVAVLAAGWKASWKTSEPPVLVYATAMK